MSFTRRIAVAAATAGRRPAVVEERGADPTLPWGDSTPPPPSLSAMGTFLPSGNLQMTPDSAMQLMVVYACVSIIADAVATLPMYAYRDDENGAHLRLTKQPQIIVRPFAEITLQDWLTQVMVSLLLRGNAYLYVVERDGLGFPLQLMVVPPDLVKVDRDRDTGLRRYRIGLDYVDTDDVIHIPAISMPGSLEGLNPIQYARMGLSLAKSTEAYGAKFFDNSAEASGIISVEGDLNEDETRKLAQSWIAAHQGIGRAHLPAVLTGGAKWTSISINPDDAQFLQTREYQRHEIAMLFRIPEHMLGMQDRTSSWGTGIEQMEIGFVVNTLRPWLSRIEAALSDALAKPKFVRFDLSGRLRGDTLQRFQAYEIALNNSLMCADEIRAKEDLPPLPNDLGKRFYSSVQGEVIPGQPGVPDAPEPEPPIGQEDEGDDEPPAPEPAK